MNIEGTYVRISLSFLTPEFNFFRTEEAMCVFGDENIATYCNVLQAVVFCL